MTTYIRCATSRKEYAEGFAAGSMDSEDDEWEIVVDEDCPPDKIFITDKPLVYGTYESFVYWN